VLALERLETAAPPLAIDLAGEDLASGSETWTTLPGLGETVFSDGGTRRGTDYMHARFSSPITGRFLSVDPVLQVGRAQHMPQLWNRYAYGVGNPLKYVDPTGQVAQEGTAQSCEGLVGCIRAFFQNLLQSEAPPPQASADDPNVQALMEEYGEAKEHPANLAGNVQQGLNEFAVEAGTAVTATAVVVGANMATDGAINVMTKGLGHVVQGHTIVGAQTAGKSIFRAEENVVDLIKAASSVTPTRQGNGNLAFVVNAGRAIGHDARANGPTSFYTVITDSSRNLVTAFPGLPGRR
jgi:RHS repeat-associated protein